MHLSPKSVFLKFRPIKLYFIICSSLKHTQIDKIDIEYFRRQPRLDIHEETKINVDENLSNEYYSKNVEGSNNFISEVFFLNVAAHHYGLGATETTHDQLAKDIGEMEKHLERFVVERQRWLNVRFHEPPHSARLLIRETVAAACNMGSEYRTHEGADRPRRSIQMCSRGLPI